MFKIGRIFCCIPNFFSGIFLSFHKNSHSIIIEVVRKTRYYGISEDFRSSKRIEPCYSGYTIYERKKDNGR